MLSYLCAGELWLMAWMTQKEGERWLAIGLPLFWVVAIVCLVLQPLRGLWYVRRYIHLCDCNIREAVH